MRIEKTTQWLAMTACAALLAHAETYHWTGAVDGAWTNPANWAENAVPGRYRVDGAVTGETGDTAVFGDTLAGSAATTIDFADVYSVRQILTTGTNRFTYGTSTEQYVPIEPFGVFSAAETVETPAAVIRANLRLGVELMATNWGGEEMTVRNNSSEMFSLGKWGFNTAHPDRGPRGEPAVCFDGTGDIRLADTYNWGVWARWSRST